MHSNEFEKQVQQKAGELKVAPSESLWDKIEAQLPAPKKRRRPLAWLLLPLLGITMGIVWFIKKENSIESAAPSLAEQASLQKATTTQPLTTMPDSPATNLTHQSPTVQPSNLQSITSSHQKQGAQRMNFHRAITSYADDKKQTDNRLPWAQRITSKGNTKIITNQGEADTWDTDNDANTWLEQLNMPAAFPIKATHIGHNTALLPMNKVPITGSPRLAENTTIKSGHSSKWSYGIIAGAGISNRPGHLLFGNNTFGSNNVSTPGSLNNNKQPTTGVAFSAGMYLQKQLYPKWYVQTGLQYTLLTTQQKIGRRLGDSVGILSSSGGPLTLGSVFLRGDTLGYTNRMHLIQLPVELQYRLGANSKFRLLGGLTIAYMPHSNAVAFNGSQYVSYPEMYNRWQLGAHTGIGYCPNPAKSFALGLRIHASINSVVDKKIEKQRLLSAMLYAQIPLHKK